MDRLGSNDDNLRGIELMHSLVFFSVFKTPNMLRYLALIASASFLTTAAACGQSEWVCFVVPRQTTFTSEEQNLRCYNPNVEHCIDDWVCARELDARCGDICYNSKTHVCHEPQFHLCHIGAKGYCEVTKNCFDDKHYICDPVRGLIPRSTVPNAPPVPSMPVLPVSPARPPVPVRPVIPQPPPVAGSFAYRYRRV